MEVRSVCLSLDDGNKGFALRPFVHAILSRHSPSLAMGGRECSTAVFADGIRTKKAMNKTTKETEEKESV